MTRCRAGVHGALDVNDVAVLKAAHHVGDGVSLPGYGRKLVAQALTLAGPLHEARDVHELHDGWNFDFGTHDLSETGMRGSGTFTTPSLGLMVQKG